MKTMQSDIIVATRGNVEIRTLCVS